MGQSASTPEPLVEPMKPVESTPLVDEKGKGGKSSEAGKEADEEEAAEVTPVEKGGGKQRKSLVPQPAKAIVEADTIE